MIRSTVNFPVDLHRKLRLEAINKNMTFSGLILSRLTKEEEKKNNVKKALALFQKIRSSGPDFDGVEAINEIREKNRI